MDALGAAAPSPRIESPWDVARFPVRDSDVAFFQRTLRDWMPAQALDIHAHVFDLRMLHPGSTEGDFAGPPRIGLPRLRARLQAWMGDRAPSGGLLSGVTARHLDVETANRFVLAEADGAWRGLLLIRPADDPAVVERRVREEGWLGFKVHHLFAAREDMMEAEAREYLPEWAWEIANRSGLILMIHLVRSRAVADPIHQHYIRDGCTRFPNARLVLAHAARAFCGRHAVEGVTGLPLVENIFFDTSAACDPPAFQAILRRFGSERLLFGTDFPISEVRVRPLSAGDGLPTLTGIESLLALRTAGDLSDLTDADLERIFRRNAESLMEPRRQSTDCGARLYAEATALIPGGTQLLSKRPELYAPGQWPAYYREARGCEVIDVDGRRFLDFLHNGVGSCLLGYAHPEVSAAVVRRIQRGSMCTLNSPEEVELAGALLALHPWAGRVRYARTGGEALAVAVRIARASTGRNVIAFCGYHGWSDWYLAANLADEAALDGHLLPGLPPLGVPRGLRGTAFPFRYNDLDSLGALVQAHGGDLAAVVMEPTRDTPPRDDFLGGVRELCHRWGAKLIFDEVTAGFRLHRGGAHLLYGTEPDLAVFAKALGNGHPIAAVIGNAATMEAAERTFISSTYWTEGCGPTAALATLRVMSRVDLPAHVARMGERFRQGCSSSAEAHGLPLRISGHPALVYLAFDHADGQALMTLFTVRMLAHGFLAGATFYPTLAHEESHIDAFLRAADHVFGELAESMRKRDTAARIGGRVRQTGFTRLTGSGQ